MSQPLAVGNAPFATRSTVLLLCLAGASMVTAFLLLVFRSDQLTRSTVDANAYSVSALGHRALVALLQATHRPVVISRFTKGTLTQRAMVICAEPLTDESERAVALAKDAAVFLLVLPKRHGLEGGDRGDRDRDQEQPREEPRRDPDRPRELRVEAREVLTGAVAASSQRSTAVSPPALSACSCAARTRA